MSQGAVRWKICTSPKVEEWVERCASSTTEAVCAVTFRHQVDRLELLGTKAGVGKKLGDLAVLQLTIHKYRVYYGFASGRRVCLAVVDKKLTGKFPQARYKLYERQVRQYIEMIEATVVAGSRGKRERRR